MRKRVVMPLPDVDFDPTETSVPWHVLTSLGHEVVFSTEHGRKAACDPLLLTGVVFGQLGAKDAAKTTYQRMTQDPSFNAPIRWKDIAPSEFHGMVLPGGHAPGMKQYLGSGLLQDTVRAFFSSGKPVGAICHGVLVAARAGVLHGRVTTCLPAYMEGLAYASTFWKLGRYYRTYDAYVEDEVKAALEHPPSQFRRGPITLFKHGTESDDDGAFTVRDGSYVSARWPGDAWKFAREFALVLNAAADAPGLPSHASG